MTRLEALRLAAELDAEIQRTVQLDMMHHNAATELRRLHEENGRLRIVAEMSTLLLDQRSALLEALDQCLNGTLIGGHTHNDNGLEVLAERCGSPHVAAELRRLAGIARAAIKAVEGEQA